MNMIDFILLGLSIIASWWLEADGAVVSNANLLWMRERHRNVHYDYQGNKALVSFSFQTFIVINKGEVKLNSRPTDAEFHFLVGKPLWEGKILFLCLDVSVLHINYHKKSEKESTRRKINISVRRKRNESCRELTGKWVMFVKRIKNGRKNKLTDFRF